VIVTNFNSSPNHTFDRFSIRDTWGGFCSLAGLNCCRVRFVIGDDDSLDENVDSAVARESEMMGDIIKVVGWILPRWSSSELFIYLSVPSHTHFLIFIGVLSTSAFW
jgi:hypothetical protein